MHPDAQTIAALAIVIITIGLLARSLLKKKAPGCGGGCGCPSATIKAKLKP